MVHVPAAEVTETVAVETPVVETKKSKKSKKAEVVTVPTTEATTPAEPAAPAIPKGPTQRLRIFQGLAAIPMTGREIANMLGGKSIPMILKDEGVCVTPRIQRAMVAGKKGVVYSLTAAGLADLEAGKVDENAAPSSPHLEWPGLPAGKAEALQAAAEAKAKKEADKAAAKAAKEAADKAAAEAKAKADAALAVMTPAS